MNISGFDGLEFLKYFKKIPNHQDTPIIMVTSESEKRFFNEALEAGVTDYLVKPFKAEALWEKVQQYYK